MVTFSGTEKPLNIAEIQNLEELVGLKFPSEYISHLLKYNGGQCYPNVFTFDENGKRTKSAIDWFLAIYDGEYDNLRKNINIYKIDDKRLPSHILPIAHDPGGNLICISCGLIDNGYIYFWDHEKEVNYSTTDDMDYKNLSFIANSFSEFLDNLKEE